MALPTWPSTWIQIDWDRNENGAADDWRDVEYAYYQYDSNYLYLKLKCYALPGSEWPAREGRYKWFIDLDGNMYYSGGNTYDAEYLLFVEDTNYNGVGEIYLVSDANGDNNFSEYEPWPPLNYLNYRITDQDIGGFRIVGPNQIEMYIRWSSIGNPPSYGLFWTTDQQNPNLDQSPTTDRVDEAQPIVVHNVAAKNQTPVPTVVKQGEHVAIQVVVENVGTHAESFNVTCYADTIVIGTQLVTDLAAGHQATLNFDWDTTGVASGIYAIKAWADSSAAISESDEVDNWCTSPATVTIQPAPIHDVAAVSQVPDKTVVVQGAIVNINVTVSNLGDFTETFNVMAFYGSSPISYQSVPGLASKASTSLIFVWNTSGVPPNTYYVRAMADSSRVIAETNEINNNCTSFETVIVYGSGQMGKLFVDKVKTGVISGADPPVVGYPTVYELTIIVTNIGGSNVINVQVNETISAEVAFVSAGTPSQGSIVTLPPPKIVWNVGTLTPGANATLTFRVRATPPSPGLMYLNHKEGLTASGKDTPSGNLVSDTGDTDTTVVAIVRDVAAISQVPSSTVVPQGDTIAIDVTVRNLGNVSETFDVTAYYDNHAIGTLRVVSLLNGSETVLSFGWDTTGVLPGTYSIKAVADSSGEIAESNETNNICTSPATVEIVIHDIAILSQSPSPTAVVQGEIVTISVVIRNEGTEPESFSVSCYINETLLEIKTVTNLQPSTTTTLNFFWNTTGAPAGKFFINTQASVVPGEKDTSDNACKSATSVTVTSPIYQITFRVTGVLPDFTSTIVTIDSINYNLSSLPKTFLWISGSVHSFSYHSPLVVTPNEKRYVWNSTTGLSTLQSGSITVTVSGEVAGHYKDQYYLTVVSDYGTPSGQGWYYSGATAYANLDTGIVEYINRTRRVFTNWSVDASGTNYAQSNPITMSGPKTAKANWKTQYLLAVRTDPAGLIPQPTRNIAGDADSLWRGWWYDASTNVELTAPSVSYLGAALHNFQKWKVDSIDKIGNPIIVVMNQPHEAIAYYTAQIPVGGVTVSIDRSVSADVFGSFGSWIIFAFAIIYATVATATLARYKKQKK